MVRRSLAQIAAGSLLFAGLAGFAVAQPAADLGALGDHLAEMADTVTGIQLAQSSPVNAAAAAQLDLRLSALEEEIRRLTGKVEEAQNSADQANARLKSFQEDVQLRLERLEGGAGTGGGGMPPAAPTPGPSAGAAPAPAPTSPPASGGGSLGAGPSPSSSSPQALAAYDKSLGLLRRGEYEQAEAELKAFIATYGTDKLAGNAQYWLGETYYVRGNYDAAAQAFLGGVKTYPDSAKAPDTFLKLGMSLIQMGQKEKGCQVLGELPTRYSDASATIKSRADRERKAAGCA